MTLTMNNTEAKTFANYMSKNRDRHTSLTCKMDEKACAIAAILASKTYVDTADETLIAYDLTEADAEIVKAAIAEELEVNAKMYAKHGTDPMSKPSYVTAMALAARI